MPAEKPATRQIITDNDTLRKRYQSLKRGDLFVGRLRMKSSESGMLLDLVSRGVQLIPSATSQLASRSKTFQVLLFAEYMLPHTLAIHDQHDLLAAVNIYGKQGINRVVTKHDRRNAGLGVHLWHSVEDVFTQASFNVVAYPFVLQPFKEKCRDIRVIVLEEYVEAYRRDNPNSFRNNLHCGGESRPVTLTDDQLVLCRKVLERGEFPYGHLDLMVTAENKSYLTEINLRGGMRGAEIDAADYRQRLEVIHQRLIREKE